MSTTITDACPDIAVIIPHYNDVDRLARCLTELMKNDIAGAEILVVDNASPEPPDRLHAAFPAVRFLTETGKGAGPARNRGVAESRAPLLAFVDADCVPAHDWLTVARRVVSDADLVSGRVDVFDETPAPRSGPEAFEKVFAFNCQRYVEMKGLAITANMITSRRVFEDVGPFRTVVSEDSDWSHRAAVKGYRLIYAHELCVSHPSRADWPTLRRKWVRLTQESFALAKSRHSDRRARLAWALRALAMPASALVHLPKLVLSKRLGGPDERLLGAVTLIRLRCMRMVWMLRQALGARL